MARLERRQRRVVVASLSGVFVSLLPFLMVVAALPEIADDLDTSEAALGWVLTAPLLLGAVLLPAYGRIGDLFGHRRVFLVGLTLSGAFAALAAAAWNPASLIVFRTISQTAGSATGPAAIALVISSVDEHQRPRVLGHWAFVMGIAPAVGLLLGGPAVEAFSWRGLFVMQAAMVAAVLPMCLTSFAETPRRAHVSFDVAGSAAFMLAGGSIVFAIDRAGGWRWDHPAVIGAVVLFPLALLLFRTAERRARDPILPLSLVRHRGYVSSCACEFLIQVSTNAALFVAPLMYHAHYGAGASRIALYLSPMPLGMAMTAPFGGRLTQRLGERRTAVTGTLALATSLLAFFVGDAQRSIAVVLLAWFAVGASNGLIRPAIASAAAAALEPAKYGAGMATTRMISTAGAAAGITLAIGMLGVGELGSVLVAAFGAGLLATVAATGLARDAAPMRSSRALREVAPSPGPS